MELKREEVREMCRVTMGHLRVTVGHLRVSVNVGHMKGNYRTVSYRTP